MTFAALVQKMFDGVDSEALLAIPFFLLVGELMSSANVVQRVINLSLTLVGHMKGGLSQVVAVFSMFFSEMSGSTSADVAVMTRALGEIFHFFGMPQSEARAAAFVAVVRGGRRCARTQNAGKAVVVHHAEEHAERG